MAEVFIYVYSNRRLGKAYIGHSNNPEHRAYAHYKNWAKQLDADKNNWQIGVIEIVEAKSRTKFALKREQMAIDAFIAEFGEERLLNKNACAAPGKITGKINVQKAHQKSKELGQPGVKAGAKASALKLAKAVSLWHQDYGICTAKSQHEFARTYPCNRGAISAVVRGELAQHKSWRLPIESQDYCSLPSAQEPSHE